VELLKDKETRDEIVYKLLPDIIFKKNPRILLIEMEITIATRNDTNTISENNIQMALETENICLVSKIALDGVINLIDDPSKGFYLLAKEDDEIVGQLLITYEWSDWRDNTIWWIQSVYVHPSHRKQGVFQTLYEYIKTLAIEQKVTLLRLYVHHHNQSAIDVYTRIGMKKTDYLMYEREL